MNDPQPPQLDAQEAAQEAALEAELEQLKPLAVPPELRETALGTLDPSLSASERSLEDDLTALRPSSVDSSLWERLEAGLDDEPTNVVSVPRWRDFTPIFKLAAAIAIGLFAAWSIKTDIPQDAASASTSPKSGESTVSEQSGQFYTPVSRSGTIQGTSRVGFMEKDKRVYERQLQTRRDRSHYRIDKDLRVEDEVTRQRQVISPLVTY